ncbi:MAG: class I SAM-dependent methyltransferase [Phycisphaerae bacterium]|nr:class I SAM-dependent methyltransferase [Phycisphaerae bacterium]
MTLFDLPNRTSPPDPFSEGDNIPWNEPAFSERMLKEHLSQDHDAASRRLEKIQNHVQWIHRELLRSRPARILELACGPGLYTSRLASLGHECVGIDYSPASIAYAIDTAKSDNLACMYLHQDIREADYGTGFNLVMLIYGELNVFRPKGAGRILAKAYTALNDGGLLLLEPHTFSAVEKIGNQARSWYSAQAGLFSDKPHLCLQEHFWDGPSLTATTRYFIIDAATANVSRHAVSYKAYTDEQYRSLLTETGFEDIRFCPSLADDEDHSQQGLIAIVARK